MVIYFLIMLDTILTIHKYYYGNNARFKYKRNNKIKWVISNVMSQLCCRILFVLLYVRRFLKKKSNNKDAIVNENIVVSLTSFPRRINHVWMVIDSLCRQDMRPYNICLTLSLEEFPNGEKDLSSWLLQYKKYGLKILWTEDNLMPHKKYLMVMRLFKDKYIITVDDDIYYRKDLISHLWKLSQKFKHCVCGNNVSCILNKDLSMSPYNYWNDDDVLVNSPSHNYIVKGCGGVIYPPKVFKNEDAFNKHIIIETCLRADDLWLKAQELINDVKIVKGDFYPTSIELSGSGKSSLRNTNTSVVYNGNDKQWANLDKVLHINNLLKERVLAEQNTI